MKHLKVTLLGILSYIDKIVYRFIRLFTSIDEKLVIFEGTMGRFDESSLVLYRYMQKKRKYKFVWMVKCPQHFVDTIDTKFISRYSPFLNLRADYYYSKARYSFYTHATSTTKYKRKGQTKVFIGHGYAIKGHKGAGNTYHNFDFALATGIEAITTQALFVGCDEEKMLPLGLPRNDLLVQNSRKGNENPLVEGMGFSKIILWMPTFRDSKSSLSETSCATETGLPLFDTPSRIEKLNDVLHTLNSVIILKPHILQLEKAIFKRKFSNIIIINDDDISKHHLQLYEFIGLSDALLTDYSSVSIDYLLLDKPIGYILSDIDLYMADRGFTSEDPRDVMAGNLIYTEDEAYRFIGELVEGKDKYKECRALLRKRLHAADKGNSCELICNYFKL